LKLVVVAAAFLAVAAVVLCLSILLLQRKILFPAPEIDALSTPAMLGEERLRVRTGSEEIDLLLLPPLESVGPATWLVFAHGNGEVIDLWAGAFEPLREAGVGISLVEYPGYGQSTGKPSEASIRRAMVAAYDRLLERPDVDPQRVVGYGRSLGGGAVCALARDRPLAALILESSFTSVPPLARRLGVPRFLVLDRFDNEAVVRDFSGPVLVLHGVRDPVIPIEHARELARVAADSRMIEMPCGHNDCPRDWDDVTDFLRKGSGLVGAL